MPAFGVSALFVLAAFWTFDCEQWCTFPLYYHDAVVVMSCNFHFVSPVHLSCAYRSSGEPRPTSSDACDAMPVIDVGIMGNGGVEEVARIGSWRKPKELINSDSRLHIRPIDAPSVSAYRFVSCNAPKLFSFKASTDMGH